MCSESKDPVTSIFGSNVFSEAVMRERLPEDVYKALKPTISEGRPLDASIAGVVANAMKDWAIEKGATHFCHWFQPMTGVTAEKHDSFISPTSDGRTIMEFSGKELIQGEPDASSFPCGGLRATFEARGYTEWDCTSPVFVKENGSNVTLYIPSAFCSYTSEALDKKTPLLRSIDALSYQCLRVLRALGNNTSKRVIGTLGPEQEYFLVDAEFVKKRLDLVLAGRTLFGAPPPKGQEMEDHYYGALHERVACFMNELNVELWKLGVSARTQHNEVAPAQYELAPVFGTVNVATDHNQLCMETMQKVALRHGFVCLLHEKPFAGVSGSGKHNNWSMMTSDGINLLDPGTTPHDNEQFLIMLCAVVRAVDKYAGLLRASVASAGNDHRLGANEAPPAIISIFLGDQLTDIFEQLEKGGAKTSRQSGELKLGINTMPSIPKDCTDRNRTSPFAFTGNKFEFRMVGSSQSTAGPTFVLNTIVADVLGEIADELEKSTDVHAAAQALLQRIATQHKKIIFNGDSYAPQWEAEAERRGLLNIRNSVDGLRPMLDTEVETLFEKHGVLSKHELHARYEILLERYCKEINVEALTTLQMANRQIMPAAIEYSGKIADTVVAIKSAGASANSPRGILSDLCELIDTLQVNIIALKQAVRVASDIDAVTVQAEAYRDSVVPAMNSVREVVDQLENMVDASIWPLPTYAEMLFLR
ncbi:MAG: glutamine synthetase type III [Armatimonadetes bacterium]|nr:glutamine synthetase type III [Armatimonadota bacterium]